RRTAGESAGSGRDGARASDVGADRRVAWAQPGPPRGGLRDVLPGPNRAGGGRVPRSARRHGEVQGLLRPPSAADSAGGAGGDGMMTPEDVPRDVGAYALRVLDPRDRVRFEEHLTVCRSCPRELEELSSVAALLPRVSADSLIFAERSTLDPRRSEALIGVVRKERHRTRARHGLTLAACLALVIAGTVVAVGLGLGQRGLPGLRGLRGLPGLPGDSTTAPKLHAVSQSTGADATVQVAEKRWGSQVTLRITHVKGPVACRLIAVSKEDQSEVVMGWSVPPEGYGTAAQPKPLVLYGGTDLSTANLSRFEVRTVNGALLVSVPT